MTTTKRTPLCGPYRAEGSTIKALDHGEWFTIARCDCKRLIAEGNAANAEFLASAPDLLRQRDKLKATLESMAEICESDGLEHCRPFSNGAMTAVECHRQATIVRGVLITLSKQARAILAETEAA